MRSLSFGDQTIMIKFIKQLFCRHDWYHYVFWQEDLIHGYERIIIICEKCDKKEEIYA